MKVYIGADHGGFALKDKICTYLKKVGKEFEDLSGKFDASDDYPYIAKKVGEMVVSETNEGKDTKGILICGTGTGMNIAANKVKGIRAAPLVDEDKVLLGRLHNDINVLCLPGLVFIDLKNQVKGCNYSNLLSIKTKPFSIAKAKKLIDIFLCTQFEGGRHKKRVDMIEVC